MALSDDRACVYGMDFIFLTGLGLKDLSYLFFGGI